MSSEQAPLTHEQAHVILKNYFDKEMTDDEMKILVHALDHSNVNGLLRLSLGIVRDTTTLQDEPAAKELPKPDWLADSKEGSAFGEKVLFAAAIIHRFPSIEFSIPVLCYLARINVITETFTLNSLKYLLKIGQEEKAIRETAIFRYQATRQPQG